MSGPIKILLAWSGGKDSAMALWKLRQDPAFEVVGLLTTGNRSTQRVSMHGVRLELVRAQAESAGLPLIEMLVEDATYEGYEQKMEEVLRNCMNEHGIEGVAFGDIFLEDLRKYREEKMALLGLKAFFPLWKEDTTQLVHEFIRSGFRTVLCCVSDGYLQEECVGKELSEALVRKLPAGVDPCGENGEFHTFCFDGPVFGKPVAFTCGKKVHQPLEEKYLSEESPVRGFWYIDLELAK